MVKEIEATKFAELFTDRLLLRQLHDSDASAISILRSDEGVNRYIDRAKQTSIEAASAFIVKRNIDIQNGNSFYWALCLKHTPGLIGTLCVFNYSEDRTSAELGYELAAIYQGQGIANEAVKRIIAFCFEIAGFKSLVACVHKEHSKSINLLLKNNFVVDLNRKEEQYPGYIYYTLKAPLVQ